MLCHSMARITTRKREERGGRHMQGGSESSAILVPHVMPCHVW